MRKILEDYFYLRKSERNGFVVLSILTVLVLLWPEILYHFSHKETITIPPAFLEEITKLESKSHTKNYSNSSNDEESEDHNEFQSKTPKVLSPFDPNTASKNQLKQLGLNQRIINNILKYRDKGGKFKKKQDFAKLYGLSPAQFDELEPYIVLPASPYQETSKPSPSYHDTKQAPTNTITVDINTASKEEWQQLKGIGAFYADRIVSFREKLGGFATIEQVGETYKLPDTVFIKIRPHLKLSIGTSKIPLNTASFETLKAHPYINAKQAYAIEKIKKRDGKFDGIESLRKTMIFGDQELEKLTPYLDFE